MGPESPQRRVLPIPERRRHGLTAVDAKDPDNRFDPIEPLRPPKGAPNVLIVLLDDVGFGSSSAFGGPVSMPTAERLAGGGLRFNRFHTTALCAPTRAALLTGRNHHTVGMGSVPDLATSAPGYNSIRPDDCAPLAQTLRLNGYSTAQFGKCHEVPLWETSPMGPFDRWPTGSGFEHFYGFVGGETNQYVPALYEGTTAIEPPRTPQDGYHLTEDLADHAIAWVRQPPTPTTCSAWTASTSRAPIRCRRASISCGWSSPTRAADSARAATSRCTSTAPVAAGRVEATVPMIFSVDETADVGSDTGTPVSDLYASEGSRFTGRIEWVQIDIDAAAADEDHLVSPEERLRIAMARQ